MLNDIKTSSFRQNNGTEYKSSLKHAFNEYRKNNFQSKEEIPYERKRKLYNNFHSSNFNKNLSSSRNNLTRTINDSTFYNSNLDINSKTLREKELNKDNQILADLMYFVDNSSSIKKEEKKTPSPSVFKLRKEFLADTDSLYQSIYHQDKFSNSSNKKRHFKRPQSCGNYFNFDKSQYTSNHVSVMNNFVNELHHKIIDPIEEEIRQKGELRQKLLENISTLENIKKIHSDDLKISVPAVLDFDKENTQMNHMTKRLSFENVFMIKEQKFLKDEISEMKNEIYHRDSAKNEMKNEIKKTQMQINFFKTENVKLEKKNEDLIEQMKCMRTKIVLFKKDNDLLKEKIAREEQRNLRFIAGVELMVDRGKY